VIPTGFARGCWVALIGVQLAWFGWWSPSEVLGYWPALLLATVPLLLPLPWILRLSPAALVVGGMILLLHFSVAVSEAWADPVVRPLALLQIALIVVYFLALPAFGRRRRSDPGGGADR